MQAEGVIDRGHHLRGNPPYYWAEALDRHGPHLLGLGFRIDTQTRLVSGKQSLEGEHLGRLLVTGKTVITPRPKRAAVALALSLLTTTAWCFAGSRPHAPARGRSGGFHRATSMSPSAAVASQSTASPEDSDFLPRRCVRVLEFRVAE